MFVFLFTISVPRRLSAHIHPRPPSSRPCSRPLQLSEPFRHSPLHLSFFSRTKTSHRPRHDFNPSSAAPPASITRLLHSLPFHDVFPVSLCYSVSHWTTLLLLCHGLNDILALIYTTGQLLKYSYVFTYKYMNMTIKIA
ncbi:hypothetical protein E2C01_032402 [Portunus trituberculatus]|uniref:Uncharacterized protein n=1 Tax=Portunus trituberculatus TaxID=210409 RepID=A0A5B7F0N1_PORTR|nr:hypothetical protein [Portunus trituberculatus]